MYLKKTATILFFTLSLPADEAYASGFTEDECDKVIRTHKSRMATGVINLFNPVQMFYDLFLKTNSARLDETLQSLVQRSLEPGSQDSDCKDVIEFMSACAIKGHLNSMYEMGLLLTYRASPRFQHLSRFIEPDFQLGESYLKCCDDLGYAFAKIALQAIRRLKESSRKALTLVGEIDNQKLLPQSKELVQVLNFSTESDKTLREIAIVRLSSFVERVPLLLDGPFERRVAALQLLNIAAELKSKSAQRILISLQEQDRLYTEICRMMMEDKDKVIREYGGRLVLTDEGEGLKLGSAGFQETYIDLLWQDQKKVLDRVLSQEQCELYKKAMAYRVTNLFHLYSSYLQYCNAAKVPNATAALDRAIEDSQDTQIVRAPIRIINNAMGFLQFRAINAFSLGVVAHFTRMEIDAARRKLLDLDDDFNGTDVEEIILSDNRE